MKRAVLLYAVAAIMLAAGCTQGVRYSQDEIRDFPPQIQDHIRNSQVAVGMNRVQVRYSWGSPHGVNVLPPSADGKERIEWVYEKLGFFRSRLIFTDDRLTEIISNEPGFAK